ncbi:MAG TPA: phosphate acyltransferase, partial [Magnetospirillaceae bacterium]|nr:phosphate acyltransferase [Magnetospirillaceae bacterium]
MRTIQEILDRARSMGARRIAVAAAQDHSALEAITSAADFGLADPILIGDMAKVDRIAGELGINVSRFLRFEVKDHGGAAAKAVELVRSGQADMLMKGILDTTVLLKAVLDKE